MKVSFNGLRKNATESMNILYDVLCETLQIDDSYKFSDKQKEKVAESFNNVAQYVDFFNCLEDDNIIGDFDCMDDLNIKRIELIDEFLNYGD